MVLLAILGTLGILLLGGSAAQERQAGAPHPTGLIPLDARQIQEIREGWPRITRAGVNRLGLERVNAVKRARGKTPIDPRMVKPVGREIESAVIGRIAFAQPVAADQDLLGDIPAVVDNSELPYFPPIRDQSPLGSCVAFATTYTQLSYMTAFQRGLDIRNDSDNADKYSPKWTYNMVNGGSDQGATLTSAYSLMEGHGACTWAEFPYDGNPRAWCLDPLVWRRALDVRTSPTQYVEYASSDSGRELVKRLLTDGYVLVFGTYIASWVPRIIQDDPSTSDDDPEVGKLIAYYLDGSAGGHAMTVVGYNDAIWTDINEDGRVDAGEKGAFRIANSWGPLWADQGFIWLAYDALRTFPAVPYGPRDHRVQAFQGDMCFVLTVRNDPSPLMIAEATVNHAKRNQLRLTLGRSDTGSTVPSTSWPPAALQEQGGAYAFDGSANAVDGTFVLDLSDILVEGAGVLRYYLGMHDGAPGDPATLRAFKIIDLTTDPPTEVASTLVPQSADGDQQVYSYVDYAYAGPAHGRPPRLEGPYFSPHEGTTATTFSYYIRYYDEDGDIPSVASVIIDGSPQPMVFCDGASASDGLYRFETMLAAGSHNYYFHYEDVRGGSARDPIVGLRSGPEVSTFRLTSVQPSSATAGDPGFVLTVTGDDFAEGAVIRWDGSDRPTTFVNSQRVDAEIGANDLDRGKTVEVSVHNPDGGFSNPGFFRVYTRKPIVTALSPPRTSAGGAGFILTVQGSDFLPESVVEWNGLNRPTTYMSDTELRVSIRTEDIAAGGRFPVTVVNPQPFGGQWSTSHLFSVFDFTASVLPTERTVFQGQSATFSITVEPRFGSFDSPVSLSFSGTPGDCVTSLSPESVTPGGSPVSATLTIMTRAPAQSGAGTLSRPAGFVPPGAGLLVPLLALFGGFSMIGLLSRRAVWRRLASGGLVCLLVLLSGCGTGGGGDPSDKGTPVGTYEITIRAVSGGLAAADTALLMVR